jgi:hypothetical protein
MQTFVLVMTIIYSWVRDCRREEEYHVVSELWRFRVTGDINQYVCVCVCG